MVVRLDVGDDGVVLHAHVHEQVLPIMCETEERAAVRLVCDLALHDVRGSDGERRNLFPAAIGAVERGRGFHTRGDGARERMTTRGCW